MTFTTSLILYMI